MRPTQSDARQHVQYMFKSVEEHYYMHMHMHMHMHAHMFIVHVHAGHTCTIHGRTCTHVCMCIHGCACAHAMYVHAGAIVSSGPSLPAG